MSQSQQETSVDGQNGKIVVTRWEREDPRFVVLLAHGYGEHAGRYAHVAEILAGAGGVVYAPDHQGHGKSDGDRVLINDFADVVEDFHAVAKLAESEHDGLPIVVIGHSMGGLVATRYTQTYPAEVGALVLSGPIVGGNPAFEQLLEMDEIPDIPIDPEVLSRDPAVGKAYADDELVWHGPFKRETLQALFDAIGAIADAPSFGEIPLLWIHGEDDQLVPIELQRPIIEALRGQQFEHESYPGARHEVFNETNSDVVIADVIHFIERCLGAPPDDPHPQDELDDSRQKIEGN